MEFIKNNKLKVFLTCLLLIAFTILILLIKARYETEKFENSISKHYDEPTLSYSNSIDDVYKGYRSSYKISYNIKNVFIGFLPMISDDIMNKNENELRDYYTTEKEIIDYNFGTDNEEEFVDIATKLQRLNCNLSDVDTILFLSDSYKKNDTDEWIGFKISYSNGESINCTAFITGNDLNMKIKISID